MKQDNEIKNISINFYGEEISIKMPTSLNSLRKIISEKFMFDPKDAKELIVSYYMNFKQRIINTEKDFVDFIKTHIPKIDLGISEQSKIYKENLNKIEESNNSIRKRIKELTLKKEEINKTSKQNEQNIIKKMKEIMNQILSLKQKNIEYEKSIKELKNKNKKENEEIDKEINKLNSQLLDEKEDKGKESIQKESKFKDIINLAYNAINIDNIVEKAKDFLGIKNDNNEIHYHFICDGCKKGPIQGRRYHCLNCSNFDYCEKCYKENEKKHEHSFQCFEKSIYPKPERKINLCTGKKELNKTLHYGIKCDGCNVHPIKGVRYKCNKCKNLDYCEKCYLKIRETHKHNFLKFRKPKEQPISISAK